MSRTAFCRSGVLPSASTVFVARSFLDPQTFGELLPGLVDAAASALPGTGC
ncbi:MAG: hypothetical protein ACN6QY_22025 [Pseudomonas sp.]|uniref:hypothetical protein n=1 Tax=Pseudomonas sp. TaxID=306 RepID=UPI003D0DAA49